MYSQVMVGPWRALRLESDGCGPRVAASKKPPSPACPSCPRFNHHMSAGARLPRLRYRTKAFRPMARWRQAPHPQGPAGLLAARYRAPKPTRTPRPERVCGCRPSAIEDDGLTCAARLVKGEFDQSAAYSYYTEDREAGFVLLSTAQPRSEMESVTHRQWVMRDYRRERGLPAPHA